MPSTPRPSSDVCTFRQRAKTIEKQAPARVPRGQAFYAALRTDTSAAARGSGDGLPRPSICPTANVTTVPMSANQGQAT